MSRKNISKISRERMEILYKQALSIYTSDPEQSRRYIQLLEKISQRTRTKVPYHIRRNICRKCNTPLIQGNTVHTRIRQKREPHIATTCHHCGHVTRIPLRSKET
jgi:ribonuclease P protein subunit RPR2